VQFHPTGMVWPPSVAGMLVTEGVRGEGGILTKADGKRFMFDFIPDNYKAQTADNEEEGLALHSGRQERAAAAGVVDARSRRALHRARDQGRAGDSARRRLSRYSWIKKRMSNAEEHIKRKLPSMYHQFKALGDVDITKEPMEVGPTTHYIMGGVHVNADTQMSDVPGLFAAGECAAGINGANGSAAIRYPILSYSENAPANSRRNSRKRIPLADRQRKDRHYAREALKAVREQRGENPYSVQRDLQEVMQHNVGIVRDESEMRSATRSPEDILGTRRRVGVIGNRDFNPGWHTALDLKNLLTVSEAITRAALERKESRGAQFREDYPEIRTNASPK
jgi:succinate dehydrogenase / fumarate reductase flavoprotein subunit